MILNILSKANKVASIVLFSFVALVLFVLHLNLIDNKCIRIFETHDNNDAASFSCQFYDRLLNRGF